MVEIAIVMVIIGLLIGGVLKGQAMVQNAKVKRVVKQGDEIRAGVMAFYDKYGVYPGDEDLAPIPPGADAEGDGDGQIDNNAERFEVYRDLQLAGLIAGGILLYEDMRPTMTLAEGYAVGGAPMHTISKPVLVDGMPGVSVHRYPAAPSSPGHWLRPSDFPSS